jgi:hypothetical protein
LSPQVHEQIIRRHIETLNLKSVAEYQSWCRQHGFSTAINKGDQQREKEIKYVRDSKAVRNLKKSNAKMTLAKAVDMIRRHDNSLSLGGGGVYGNILSISVALNSTGLRDLFLDVILHIGKVSSLLETTEYITAIARTIRCSEKWIRSYTEWKPKSYNADRQFSSYLRHLFARYEVPLFLNALWDERRAPVQAVPNTLSALDNHKGEWFIHVGQGQNIYTAPGFIKKYPMTKKMTHLFMQAPNTYTLDMAFRYAQVMSIGGSRRVVEALFPTKMMNTVISHREEFYMSLMKFFVANPMLDSAHYGPIIDYIWYCKYDSHQEYQPNGLVKTVPPEQPNFSMNGRNADTLLNQVEAWHKKLGKEKKGALCWDHSRFHDYELFEGEGKNRKTYRIIELLSAKELSSEGKHMRHCVSSYSGSCAHGSVSIWSLSLEADSNVVKMVTIEVRNANRVVCQIRGQMNRSANQKEMAIIKRWAAREGLSVTSYI